MFKPTIVNSPGWTCVKQHNCAKNFPAAHLSLKAQAKGTAAKQTWKAKAHAEIAAAWCTGRSSRCAFDQHAAHHQHAHNDLEELDVQSTARLTRCSNERSSWRSAPHTSAANPTKPVSASMVAHSCSCSFDQGHKPRPAVGDISLFVDELMLMLPKFHPSSQRCDGPMREEQEGRVVGGEGGVAPAREKLLSRTHRHRSNAKTSLLASAMMDVRQKADYGAVGGTWGGLCAGFLYWKVGGRLH